MATRRRLSRIHAIAGALAFVIILLFLSFSAIVELSGDFAAIARVKASIAWALPILVAALVTTGASGLSMAGSSPRGLLASKSKRMRVIAGNGILVLVPSVLFLAWKAANGQFDKAFIIVQLAELAAGSINLVLMGQNIRDGLRLTGRLRLPRPASRRPAPTNR